MNQRSRSTTRAVVLATIVPLAAAGVLPAIVTAVDDDSPAPQAVPAGQEASLASAPGDGCVPPRAVDDRFELAGFRGSRVVDVRMSPLGNDDLGSPAATLRAVDGREVGGVIDELVDGFGALVSGDLRHVRAVDEGFGPADVTYEIANQCGVSRATLTIDITDPDAS